MPSIAFPEATAPHPPAYLRCAGAGRPATPARGKAPRATESRAQRCDSTPGASLVRGAGDRRALRLSGSVMGGEFLARCTCSTHGAPASSFSKAIFDRMHATGPFDVDA